MVVNLFVFILGAVIGSFLNVCIYRLPREKSIAWPGSYCPKCNEPVKFYDNIPLLSYILLRGRCRTCKRPIPLRYPTVEFLTGLLFILINSLLGSGPGLTGMGFYFNAVFICFLIISFFSDLETQTIPDQPVYMTIAAGLAYNMINSKIFQSLLGMVLGFSVLYGISCLGKFYYKKDVLGDGDIKLAAAFGAFLGPGSLLVSLTIGYLVGAAAGITLIISGRKKMGDYIPFAPALASGALIAVFFGKQLFNYYVANFF